ncbi:MAG: hypothetical protein U1U88_001188 [Lawsonella clevelandensis]
MKIRGHRIELGEIDAALRGQEQVDQAFSLVHQDVHSGAHQVAAVVTPPTTRNWLLSGRRCSRSSARR